MNIRVLSQSASLPYWGWIPASAGMTDVGKGGRFTNRPYMGRMLWGAEFTPISIFPHRGGRGLEERSGMAIFMVVVFEKGALGWKSSYPIVEWASTCPFLASLV